MVAHKRSCVPFFTRSGQGPLVDSGNLSSIWQALQQSWRARFIKEEQDKANFGNLFLSGKKAKTSTDTSISANDINDYFCSVACEIVSNQLSISSRPVVNPIRVDSPVSFCFEQISESVVLKLISNLEVRKATGHDGISCRIIRLFKNFIAKPISVLINKSLSTYVVPSAWKRVVYTDQTRPDQTRQNWWV